MKRMAPTPPNCECVTTVIRATDNVVMYDVIVEHEIIGYFVGINNTPGPENFVEFADREAADKFFDRLNVRVELANRGICLN